ncbi:PDDEXK family nuclease [Enterobacter asburiae]|uniref:hypothetical protein n=1 Tax=Enterobacter asburiae TaxID=61645 RepID=UPI00192B6B5A|nr:hypothetical protein [Enterobacter asburiae]MBL5924967.1 hypothetical protein [Enterobacter asburiae]MBL5955754.1 hypothetical protein [Enterobacter asburiae]
MSKPDWEAIESAYRDAGMPELLYGHLKKSGEAFLSGVVKVLLASQSAHIKLFEGQVSPIIRAEPEFPVPRGRVDFFLVHDDGSASVCELKDGRNGLQAVLAGIGQVICYSVQVGMSNAGLRGIRKVLIFSRTNTISDDALIIDACLKADVIPIPIGSEAEHKAAATKFIENYRKQ